MTQPTDLPTSDYPGVEYSEPRDVMAERGNSRNAPRSQDTADSDTMAILESQIRAAAVEAARGMTKPEDGITALLVNAKHVENYLRSGVVPPTLTVPGAAGGAPGQASGGATGTGQASKG